MAGVKKTLLQKEKELEALLKNTKSKLTKIQNKQKIEIGELACKNNLNEFDLKILDEAFNKLYAQLNNTKKG